MDPIQLLMNEHRVIERALDLLDATAERVREGETPAPSVLEDLVVFFREFADERHHGKEEKILFVAMGEHGYPADDGPVAVMLDEHDAGRRLVSRLRELSPLAARWTSDDRESYHGAATGFSYLLRGHIQKEDNVLYRLAQAHVPPEVYERVRQSCLRFEEVWQGEGRGERMRELIGRLLPA